MITILMPIYNGIEFMDDSVGSILTQTYIDWQLIIGVNGHECNSATFNTAKKFEKHDKIQVLDLHQITGKSNALNEMMKYVSPLSTYIALLDVDDIWNNTKLEKQAPFLNTYDVIGTKCVYIGQLDGVIPNIPTQDISSFDFLQVNPIINSSSLIRKSLCFWNPQWDGVEDYDIWLRLWKNGAAFYNCPEVLVKHRIHADSAFNAKGNSNKVPQLLQKYR